MIIEHREKGTNSEKNLTKSFVTLCSHFSSHLTLKFAMRECLFSRFLVKSESPKTRPKLRSQSIPRATGTQPGGKYNFLPLASRKPCLYVNSWWPNVEWRMHNSNYLRYIADILVRFVCRRNY